MTKPVDPDIDDRLLQMFPTDSFVGRQSELSIVQREVREGERAIVTLLGPGGVGKTRLALEALRGSTEWSGQRIALVMLAVAQRDEEIVRTIAGALNIVDHEENLRARIADALQSRPHLLLLDNLEHLIAGVRDTVLWLLELSTETRILTTSRIGLGLLQETAIEIPPLPVSGGSNDSAFSSQDAIQLFLDRARSSNRRLVLHDGDMQRIAELCARYDGLPLAIELVASWADVLTPQDMLDRHDQNLEDRAAGREQRHRSLEDAIRWSYELLGESERAFFRRISLFPGGFSRDQAQNMMHGTVPGAEIPRADGYGHAWGFSMSPLYNERPNPYEGHAPALLYALPELSIDDPRALATLLDHHLVLPAEDVDGVLCFNMLETIRSFGVSELERTGEIDGARQRHALTMLAFAEASGDFLWNVTEPEWGADRVMVAMPSLRAALNWLDGQGIPGWELVVRIVGPLWSFCQTRGLITEGRRWLERAMDLPAHVDWLRSIELPALAFLCWIQNDDVRADEVLDSALEAVNASGHTSTVGLANLVRALVLYRRPQPDLRQVLKHVDEAEASFNEWGVPHGLVGCRAIYGIVARMLGDTQQALDLFEEARQIALDAGYAWGVAINRYFAGETLRELAADDESRIPEAVAMLTEALQQTWGQGDAWSAGGALSGLACICVQRGELIEAAQMFGASATLMQRVGGSLLPADFLKHTETSDRLRVRMGEPNFDNHFAFGEADPEDIVERALRTFGAETSVDVGPPARLTKRQLMAVHDLALGLDPPAIALRRDRSISATYEILERVCERLGVDTWEEIVPAAIEQGLLHREQLKPPWH